MLMKLTPNVEFLRKSLGFKPLFAIVEVDIFDRQKYFIICSLENFEETNGRQHQKTSDALIRHN